MPRTLLFENNVPTKIISGYTYDNTNELSWRHLKPGDKLNLALPDIINTTQQFAEDLIEEQRPRISQMQTLEDNNDTYSVLVLSVPTQKIFVDDDFQLQVTFVIVDNSIYSLPSITNSIIPEIMAKILSSKKEYTLTSLMMFILSELMEMSIDVLDEIEDFVDGIEKSIIRGGVKKGWLASLLLLKSRLYDASKLIRADMEHIEEIFEGYIPELNINDMSEHVLDRGLYLLDFIDTQREELTNIINLHLAIASNVMNNQFYWLTIMGSILIIPTIISSIYGMNIPLPPISFWNMMLLITFFTAMSAIAVKIFMPKPLIR